MENEIKICPKREKELLEFSEVEICYIRKVSNPSFKISCAEDAVNILRQVYPAHKIDYKEFFYVILLNKSNIVLGVSRIGEGDISGVVVNMIEIFQLVLKSNSCSFIVSHNHPSGSLTPSESDKRMTNRLKEFAELLNVKLLDHIILTSSNYFSFAEEGIV